ncbi:hypothetical protein CAEBREN_15551 [Caenorhabditis brenneri]|uniref:Uncharacterized protein n=1 Tax=Caenorhabditis brenneri TaxID=135651 RepID=G0P2I1_CAEBE|nr:hypothetical protein CAEBREN_15551 [Caenorhabditis brenneri]
MPLNVHPQQQSVTVPKEWFENRTELEGGQSSAKRPTLEEIEDAVNYLISLHNQKQQNRDNSIWTRCISCFGLQRKPLKAKHIDQILNSLKRGVILMELTLIISIRKWEKARTSSENCDNRLSLSREDHLKELGKFNVPTLTPSSSSCEMEERGTSGSTSQVERCNEETTKLGADE